MQRRVGDDIQDAGRGFAGRGCGDVAPMRGDVAGLKVVELEYLADNAAVGIADGPRQLYQDLAGRLRLRLNGAGNDEIGVCRGGSP